MCPGIRRRQSAPSWPRRTSADGRACCPTHSTGASVPASPDFLLLPEMFGLARTLARQELGQRTRQSVNGGGTSSSPSVCQAFPDTGIRIRPDTRRIEFRRLCGQMGNGCMRRFGPWLAAGQTALGAARGSLHPGTRRHSPPLVSRAMIQAASEHSAAWRGFL